MLHKGLEPRLMKALCLAPLSNYHHVIILPLLMQYLRNDPQLIMTAESAHREHLPKRTSKGRREHKEVMKAFKRQF